eukprot:m.73045 g.73045  ORF g.73045 m.73045 type:complete len:99 (+) comp11767_c0_seq4:172-468(+)
MDWVNEKIGRGTQFSLHTRNFTTDWHSGLRIAALVSSLTDTFNWRDYIDFTPFDRAGAAMLAADDRLNIPTVLLPSHIVAEELDELRYLSFSSLFCAL